MDNPDNFTSSVSSSSVVDSLMQQNADLIQKLSAAQEKLSHLEGREQSFLQVDIQNKDLKNQLKQAQDQIASLKETTDKVNQLRRSYAQLKEKIIRLERNTHNYKKKATVLNQKYESGVTESIQIKVRNDELKQQLDLSHQRTIELEKKLTEFTRLKYEYNRLKNNTQLVEKKSDLYYKKWSIISKKYDGIHTEYQADLLSKHQKIEALEFEYQRIFKEKQNDSDRFLKQTTQLDGRIQKLLKQRARLQTVARKMRNRFADVSEQLFQQESKSNDLKAKIAKLRNDIHSNAHTIAEQDINQRASQSELVDAYEQNIQEIQNANKKLCEENNKFHSQRITNIELHNQLTSLTKKFDALNTVYTSKQKEHQVAINKMNETIKKSQCHSEQVEELAQHKNMLLEKKRAEMQTNYDEIKKENEQLKSQWKSMETLWKDQSVDYETLQEKTNSVQKLNQDLSQKLIKYKNEIYHLKNQTQQDVREIHTRIVASQLAHEGHSEDQPNKDTSQTDDKKTPDLTDSSDRIASLIGEIENQNFL